MSTFHVPKECDTSLFVSDVEESLGIGSGDSYMLCNGRVVSRSEPLLHGRIYHILPRVLGGKGGFGSMLRAIGAQIEKTTSREACRDLSGRRIRDVNNEKNLKEWASKHAEREQEKEEKEERRRAKRARYLDETPSKMNDPKYDAEYSAIMKRSEQAMQEGMTRLKEKESTSKKKKAKSTTVGRLDDCDQWNMLDGVNLDDLDSDSDCEGGAIPSTSTQSGGDMVSSSSSPSSSSHDVSSSQRDSAPSATITSSTESSGHSEDGPPSKLAKMEAPDSSTDKNVEACPKPCDVSYGAGASKTVPSVECTDPIDLEQFSSPEDLQALGMERVKAELMRRGLKCGGRPEERAKRLFSVKGLSEEDIPAKLLVKGKGQGQGKSSGK